ncbi:hypothetical protein VKT23_014035 [Stygiomarasmius scandens]|uniref:Uncharacterized protein n=1 Tax=Marasmiellus scandens TaxID=2682957 RepID=A0ABR1J4F3_9AGAR
MELFTLKELARKDSTRIVLELAALEFDEMLRNYNAAKISLTGWAHRSSDANHFTLRAYSASGKVVGSIHINLVGQDKFYKAERRRRRRRRKSSQAGHCFDVTKHERVGEI